MNEKEKRKAESRERILEAAAALFRTRGFSATGVDELMKEAGLTAGAFYAHFKSKQELFDQTLEHLIKGSAQRLTKGLDLAAGGKKSVVVEMMARYVSERHRDYPDSGCAIPAIASEISRHSKRGKATVGHYVEKWIALFERNLEGTPRVRRENSIRLISQAVGAVLLARMVEGEMSAEILRAGGRAD